MTMKAIALFAASVLVVGTVSAAPVRAHTSNFVDNLTLNFSGFTDDSMVYASYQSDNGVNIVGPEIIKVSTPSLVTIASTNMLENGYPSMTLAYNGTSCVLNFVDGPFAAVLAYRNGLAPNCTDITVSNIERTAQYQYSVTVTPSDKNKKSAV